MEHKYFNHITGVSIQMWQIFPISSRRIGQTWLPCHYNFLKRPPKLGTDVSTGLDIKIVRSGRVHPGVGTIITIKC